MIYILENEDFFDNIKLTIGKYLTFGKTPMSNIEEKEYDDIKDKYGEITKETFKKMNDDEQRLVKILANREHTRRLGAYEAGRNVGAVGATIAGGKHLYNKYKKKK